MKSILVTGGNGFIGSHLVERLLSLNYQVSVIDNLSVGQTHRLPSQVNFFQADISQPQIVDIFKRIKPEVVYHLAADNRVTSLPKETIISNVIGTFNVLEAAKQVRVKQLIFSSSAAVYGESNNLPIKETHPTKPISSYGVSKLTGELYCAQYSQYLATSVFRFANVYGPRQSSLSEGGVVSIFIDRLLKHQPLTVFGDGSQSRDFVYVGDIVDGLILALKKPQSYILNLGTNQAVTVTALISRLKNILKIKPQIVNQPARPIEIKASLFSFKQAQKTLSWQPKTSLQSGLELTVDYFKNL